MHQGFHENGTQLKDRHMYPLLILLTEVTFPQDRGHFSWWESTLPTPTPGPEESGLGAGFPDLKGLG